MRLKVRRSIFETNSSSVHAIVIDRSNEYGKSDSNYISLGYYGWDKEKLDSEQLRASYLWTALNNLKQMVEECIQESSASSTDIFSETLRELDPYVEDLTYWKNLIDSLSQKEYEFEPVGDKSDLFDYGVDHCFELIPLIEKFYKDEDLLKDYLLGKGSFILTGNDNSGFKESYEGSYLEDEIEDASIGLFYSDEVIASFPDKKVDIFIKGN